MVERRAQSPDVDKLLVKLEAAIRKGVPLDIPKAAISLFEKYEKLSPDERERFLATRIEVARGHNRSLDSQLAWAVLNELSEQILERDEMPPKRLAQFSMEVQTGRIQEKPARGRPSRSIVAKILIVAAHNILIEWKGYTVGQAQRTVASWMRTKPNLLIHESPLTDTLFLLVSKSDEVTTT